MLKINKSMIPFICVLAGSLIAVVAAYFDLRSKEQEKQETLKEKLIDKQDALDNETKRSIQYEQIIERSNSILEKQNVVIDTAEKIMDLQNNLEIANKKIIDLQNSTINQITGGDNKPFINIIIAPSTAKYGQIIFFMSNKGKISINNTVFNMVDYYSNIIEIVNQSGDDSNHSLESNSKNNLYDFNKIVSLGTMPPEFEMKVYEGKFPMDIIYLSYKFDVKWMNGFYSGVIDLKKAGNTYDILKISAWDKPNHELKPSDLFNLKIEFH